MTTNQPHEPETKGSNKAREFQDAILRSRKTGHDTPLAVAVDLLEWFLAADKAVQIATLQFAIARMWDNTEEKMESRGTLPLKTILPKVDRSAMRKKIEADTRARLDRQWLDLIGSMTGAQVRAARMLPQDMVAKIGDNQTVGSVFSDAELLAVRL